MPSSMRTPRYLLSLLLFLLFLPLFQTYDYSAPNSTNLFASFLNEFRALFQLTYNLNTSTSYEQQAVFSCFTSRPLLRNGTLFSFSGIYSFRLTFDKEKYNLLKISRAAGLHTFDKKRSFRLSKKPCTYNVVY